MGYQLYEGDCLELMQDIPDQSIDMILTDLPYGTTRNKWDSVIPYDYLWSQYERVIKPHGAIVLFGSGMFTADLMMSNRKLWRYNLIWEKSSAAGFLNANRQPLRAHEDICVFYKNPPEYHPQMTGGHKRKVSSAASHRNCKKSSNYGDVATWASYDSTDRYPRSVLRFAKDVQKSKLHPTQKPVALLEWLVKTYTNGDETVLDSCMGSGSTGVACIRTGREFIGIELDTDYFAIAERRIQAEMEIIKEKEK